MHSPVKCFHRAEVPDATNTFRRYGTLRQGKNGVLGPSTTTVTIEVPAAVTPTISTRALVPLIVDDILYLRDFPTRDKLPAPTPHVITVVTTPGEAYTVDVAHGLDDTVELPWHFMAQNADPYIPITGWDRVTVEVEDGFTAAEDLMLAIVGRTLDGGEQLMLEKIISSGTTHLDPIVIGGERLSHMKVGLRGAVGGAGSSITVNVGRERRRS